MDRGTTSRVIRAGVVVLAALTLTATAQAQRATGRRSSTAAARARAQADDRMKGFVLGVHTIAAPGLSVTGDGVDGSIQTNLGPGAGVMLGYGFNRTWSAFASLDLAKQDATGGDYHGSFGLAHFEVGARANLPYGSETNVPYVSASLGRRALGARVTDDFDGESYDLTLSGGMFALGGGIQHVLSPSLLIDGGVTLGFGRFGHFDDGDESGPLETNGNTTVRLRFGLTWRPSGRRSS